MKTTHPRKPRGVEISMSPEMVEQVMSEWEAQHPGQSVRDMGADEFANRMMVKIRASARIIPDA
jgi:hypothetical protein